MKKEQKMKPEQKIGLERIYRLIELAMQKENKKYSKRYVALAKNISTRAKVSIPTKLKIKYCKKCNSVLVSQSHTGSFLLITCQECGFVKKFRNDSFNAQPQSK